MNRFGLCNYYLLKAMLNVLQDDVYIVEQANPQIGFFNVGMMDYGDTLAKTWGTFWWDPAGKWIENTVIDCTSNVSAFGERTSVRTNFRLKKMNHKGGVEEVKIIDDPKFYKEFFTKVDKSIFIEKENI